MWGSNPSGGEIFLVRPDVSRGPPSPLDTGAVPEIKRPGQGVDHPPLLTKLKDE